MKRLLYAIGLAILTSAALVSCNGNSNDKTADNPEKQLSAILGTWRYTTMTYILPGEKPDTVSVVFRPDTIQIYDVYRSDSILESYLTLGDSVLQQVEMHYIFRNDSLLAKNEQRRQEVYVANITDSTLNFVFTKMHGDTIVHFETQSERCELPVWLKK